MKVLIDKNTNVIIDIKEKAEMVDNGLDVGDVVYGCYDIITVYEVESVPENVKPQKYKYIDGNFIVNSDYKEFVTFESQQIKIDLIQKALDDLIMGGM